MRVNVNVKASGPGAAGLHSSLKMLTGHQVLVGIPATDAMERKRQVLDLSSRMTGKKRKRAEKMALEGSINNAELNYILSNGSPLHNIPATPIIEGAIEDKENNKALGDDLGDVAKAALAGTSDEVMRRLKETALDAQNRVREWFVSPRNGWPPNAPSTIRAKGSSRRNIDTSSLRNSMVGLVE
jgi:hypothetical protein